MVRDYYKWHKVKYEIENFSKEKIFKEREIWWCSIGANIGHEEDGKNEKFERPVLVVKKFNKFLFLGIPLTSRCKSNKYYLKISYSKKGSNKELSLIISQIRILSSKRLIRRLAKIGDKKLKCVKESVLGLIN